MDANDSLMVYFSSSTCGVCRSLKPKITKLFNDNFSKTKQIFIDIAQYPQTTSYFEVFTILTILIFFDGKEFFRKSRNLSVDEFKNEVARVYEAFF